MTRPRVALLGARRRRQGLGPYVARWLVQAGADVPCFLGTSAETNARAREELLRIADVDAEPYVDAEQMLREHDLDALAILTPAEHHRAGLELALRHGLHVLCEKPLVWGGDAVVEETQRLLFGFAGGEFVFWENCQWPYVLPAYFELHPELTLRGVRSLVMRLSPSGTGRSMLVDSLSHPLSVLQALGPCDSARVENVHCSVRGSEPDAVDEVDVSFDYRTEDRVIASRVHLVHASQGPPRIARLGLDGHVAERCIDPEGYGFSLRSEDGRRVPLRDPLAALVEDFVTDLVTRRNTGDRAPVAAGPQAALGRIGQRFEMLCTLVSAFG